MIYEFDGFQMMTQLHKGGVLCGRKSHQVTKNHKERLLTATNEDTVRAPGQGPVFRGPWDSPKLKNQEISV